MRTIEQLLQQHINRGLKRHARMTGRDAPSKRDLEENINKRLYLPASGPGSRKQSKRYNRHGTAHTSLASASANNLKLKSKSSKKGHAVAGYVLL